MWMQLRNGGTPILSSSKLSTENINWFNAYQMLCKANFIHFCQEESGEMCEKIAGGALRPSMPDILVFMISASSFSTTNT